MTQDDKHLALIDGLLQEYRNRALDEQDDAKTVRRVIYILEIVRASALADRARR